MLTVALIQRRNLSEFHGDDDEVIEEIKKLSHVRLDRENITKIEHLEILDSITNLYLQQNSIDVIENLECLSATLRFLTLAGNNITVVQGLESLLGLGFLDLSDNFIDDFDVQELPENLSFVSFKNNACTNLPDYKERLIRHLSKLKSIDDKLIDDSEDEFSDSESDNDGDEITTSESIDDIANMCTDVLDRTSSRLEEIVEDHRDKMKKIDDKPEVSQPSSARPNLRKETDKQLMKIETKMKNLLDEFIEAERVVLNSFELPDPTTYTYSQPSSAGSSPRLTFVDDDLKENENLLNSIPVKTKHSSRSDEGTHLKPTYATVGTTTGMSVAPPAKEKIIRAGSKTKLPNRGKFRTKAVQSASENRILKDPKSKPVKSLSSNSLVRIPGARPFLKS